MRAAYIEAVGGPEMIRVGDLPKPVPGHGQVLVSVGATSFNPIDLYLRSGIVAMPMAFPYVVGCDVAGTVVELGPGATRFRVGDRVWGSNQGLLGRPGATAEFAAIGEEWLYPTPANVTDVEAASIALVGITAHLGLYQFGRLGAGETVYISGGSGGVGSIVIQMAKASGARVATTAGSPERVEFCRRLGADLALNYKTDDVPVALREFAESGIDVWFETQREPNLEVAIPLLRKRGRMMVMAGRTAKPILPLGQFYPRDCSLLGFAMFNASPDEQRRCADDIVRLLADGSLRPHIGRVFPLDQAADAQRLLEENTIGFAGTLSGKVVVEIGTKP
jgi:NADPH2:quinone reductase